MRHYDAIIVGSGPNGLAAGIVLAQQGLSVKILEAKSTIGGGTRTEPLTRPGFLHDVCSAVHPTFFAAPFLKTLPLQKFGLQWVIPPYQLAHPLHQGKALIIPKNLEETERQLGRDGPNYRTLVKPLVSNWSQLSNDVFGTMRIPKHPIAMVHFGLKGMKSAVSLANTMFTKPETKALFAGLAAHSILPLEQAFSSSFGLVLAASLHTAHWAFAKGGSASISKAMAAYFVSLGGIIETDTEITHWEQLPATKAVLFDLTPRQIARILANKLPSRFVQKLNNYTYGPGVFKMDFALSEPVPWLSPKCSKAGTLHLGGSMEEIAESERFAWQGKYPPKPYVLVSQPSLFDPSRAPDGNHTLWAYCHVPNGSEKDCSEEIIAQIERYAPGFRDTILSYSWLNARELERYNANYVGGDINGGAQFFRQLIGRPVMKWNPYKLPGKGMYICSSATPPGGGVHGMCGFHAARSALKNEFGITGAVHS